MLDLLLRQYVKTSAAVERARNSQTALERQHDEMEKSIADQISQDFGKYVASINDSLPEDRRVTEWHVHYDGSAMKKAFITIIGVGGRHYESDNFTRNEPLPGYLRSLEGFGRNYPVGTSFKMLNHGTLDLSLEEMK